MTESHPRQTGLTAPEQRAPNSNRGRRPIAQAPIAWWSGPPVVLFRLRVVSDHAAPPLVILRFTTRKRLAQSITEKMLVGRPRDFFFWEAMAWGQLLEGAEAVEQVSM